MGSLQGEAEKMVKTVVGEKLHFVLVHGLSGGGWCWYKLRCLMENSGHKVTCLDLKSAGVDQTDAKSILSFEDYNQPLMDFMSTLPDSQRVILVGHSAGGLSVTVATHKFPKKVSLAVYVAATMLQNGFITPQDFIDGVPDLSQYGDVYDVEYGLGPNQPPRSAIVKKELQRNILYPSCPQEDIALAAMLARPGPIAAILSAKFLAEDDKVVNKVPRIFIKTTLDRVLKPHQQDAMIKRWPPAQVYALESDHSPNFSAPFLLFGFLIKAAIAVE